MKLGITLTVIYNSGKDSIQGQHYGRDWGQSHFHFAKENVKIYDDWGTSGGALRPRQGQA